LFCLGGEADSLLANSQKNTNNKWTDCVFQTKLVS
jgi:hypothetical protein